MQDSVPFPTLLPVVSSSGETTINVGTVNRYGRKNKVGAKYTRAIKSWIQRILGYDEVSLARFSRMLSSDADSKDLATYLSLLGIFIFVKFLFGIVFLNIGLVTSSLTNTFDSSILVVSLACMTFSKRSADAMFTFGYARCEVLSCFTTATFLMFNAFFTFMETIHAVLTGSRNSVPRMIHFELIGVCVNLFGIVLFRANRSLDDLSSRGYSRLSNGARHANLNCIFLYILCDGIGRLVSLIGSTIPTSEAVYFIAATFHAAVAFYLIAPVFVNSAYILLQTRPYEDADSHYKRMRDVSALDGVLECRTARFWSFIPGDIIGTVQIRVRSDAAHSAILNTAYSILQNSVQNLTIQVEKDSIIE
uniref:Cation efflux protein transmembrane domain-containing protein n=1 Tax=Spongospora subterranea TaxID=70186 RepID=A0A0H5QNF4_9EUKA|eukprot:CRZ03112.1 hypothetical protein [Spongospora subterranea]